MMTIRSSVGDYLRFFGGLACVLPTFFAGTASSQTIAAASTDTDSVLSRPRPDYDPLGIRLGGFTLFPSIDVLGSFDDNVLAVTTPKISSAALFVDPKLALRSNWSRNRLDLVFDANLRRYTERPLENSTQAGMSADGRLDIDKTSGLEFSATFAKRVEPRGEEGDTFVGGSPITYREADFSLTGDKAFGRVKLQIGAGISDYRYDDVALNGADVDLSFRNFRQVTGLMRLDYGVGPGLAVFVSGDVNSSSYPNEAAGDDRRSTGYDALGGIAFGLTRLLYGEIGVGYQKQSFRNPIYPDASGLDYTATLNWNPTPLITLTGRLARTIQRSPVVGAAGIRQTTATFAVDYELLRNLLLNLNTGYIVSSFRGVSRNDHRLTGGLGARYLVSRYWSLSLNGSHGHQRAAGGAATNRSYDRDIVMAGATFQL